MIKEFKVFYEGTAATAEQLDAIEEIVVRQEIGPAWEATIRIPICVGEDGSWAGENDPNYAENARVRVESRIGGEGDFVPLIDGRIVSQDPGMNSEPGSSTLTLVVRDDSTLLHREARARSFPGQTASDVATALFNEADLGGSVEVEDTGVQPDPSAIIQGNGTAMQLLRSLTRMHPDFYAYVLPGSEPGATDCFFKRLPTTADPDLPELVLTGRDRNISRFDIQRNADAAAVHETESIGLDDLSERSGRAGSSDTPPPGAEPATVVSESDTRVSRMRPAMYDTGDVAASATGAADRSSYTLSVEGDVLPGCFPAVLTPYRMIPARLSNSRFSANYVIFKVTHTLGRSEYTQSFSLRGNAVTPESTASGGPNPAAAVAGAAAVSFNLQVDIF